MFPIPNPSIYGPASSSLLNGLSGQLGLLGRGGLAWLPLR